MNLLFLTLLDFESLKERNLYTDLLREFKNNGHNLYVISPIERKRKKSTYITQEENVTILKLRMVIYIQMNLDGNVKILKS